MSTLSQSLNALNEQYLKVRPLWKKVRDCVEGQDAVHAAGTDYLPMLSNQNYPDYQSYKLRALFFNATQRVHEALVGLMFAKEPAVETTEQVEKLYLEDITMSGENLYSFARRLAEEVLSVNRVGVLVDYPMVDMGRPLTVADAEQLNLRPYMTMYRAEDILDWRTSKVNNRQQLTFLKLAETKVETDPSDEFAEVIIQGRRILDLDENGYYRVRVYLQDGAEYVLTQESWPLKDGQPMREIPFFTISSKSSVVDVSKPLLIDLAEVNLSHYRSSADYEHGLHYTGLPTAVITGYDAQPMDYMDEPLNSGNSSLQERAQGYRNGGPGDTEFSIGSAQAWVLPNAQAKAFYLEFQGHGLSQLSAAIDRKEQQMAKLGARIIQNEKNAAESGEALGIRRHSETSVLAAVAESITNTMQQALTCLTDWAGVAEVEFTMNLDFIATKLTSEELTSVVNAWMQGAMSKESLYDLLVKGEVLTGARTFEEEQALIDTERKSMMESANGMDLNADGEPDDGEQGGGRQPGNEGTPPRANQSE